MSKPNTPAAVARPVAPARAHKSRARLPESLEGFFGDDGPMGNFIPGGDSKAAALFLRVTRGEATGPQRELAQALAGTPKVVWSDYLAGKARAAGLVVPPRAE